MAVALKTIIITELLKQFNSSNDDFLSVIRDYSDKVDNDVIYFNEIGADPNVLINNSVYPIATNARLDDKNPVSLYKLETENTEISDDELQALAYDKKSSVREQHVTALKNKFVKLAIWSLAPAADATDTPVIQTTGATVGGRKRITIEDLAALKRRCDDLRIPLPSRNLILSSEHANDLLLLDQSFRDRYNNTASGAVIKNIFGFNMWENVDVPTFDSTLGAFTRNAFGSASASSDRLGSIFFSNVNAMKAIGSTKMFYRDAEQDPENRKTVVGFKQYAIVSPVQAKGIGAIVSGA